MDTTKYINPDSDGRFYGLSSMVKADCNDCEGCFQCCRGMGDSIVLDPYDMFQFRSGANLGLEQLMERGQISLGIYDGLILPHIQMSEEKDQCRFLNEKGRCSIHSYRPGICRLFPLGRNYEAGKMDYILLTHACEKKNRTKIKVEKWIGIADASRYHQYLIKWHDFKKVMAEQLKEAEEEQKRQLNMYLLNTFFVTETVQEAIFYQEFDAKIQRIKNAFGM